MSDREGGLNSGSYSVCHILCMSEISTSKGLLRSKATGLLFHRALPSYLSEDLERLQKRAMKIIYPELSYAKALELSGLPTLYDRRESIAAKLFDEICANQSHSLHKLLPSRYQPSYYLREKRTFIRPRCKTERCKNSFLLSFVYSSWVLDINLFLTVYRNLTHAFNVWFFKVL